MIAKVIAHARDRDEALDRLAAALERHGRRRAAHQCRRSSPRSAARREFRAGKFDTGFIDRNLDALTRADRSRRAAAAARRSRHC